MTQGQTVLYIEDDVIDQKAFTRHARHEHPDLICAVASSVTEARKILAEKEFDVIVTDYRLGDGTGLDIVEEVKKTPLIFITGQGDQNIAVAAMKKGAFDYIVKSNAGNYLEFLFSAIEKAFVFGQAQKNLNAAQREIRRLIVALSQIRNSIAILDREGNIDWVNEGFENLFGCKYLEVKNKPLETVRMTNGSVVRHIKELLEEISSTGKSLALDSKIVSDSGTENWAQTIITPVVESQGNITQYILVDTIITEKKKMEQHLKNKIEELNNLIYRITHDIRGPIASAKGLVTVALHETSDAVSHNFLHMIESSIGKLDQSLLSLAQMLSVNVIKIKKTEIDFDKIISSVIASAKMQPEAAGVTFEKNIKPFHGFHSDEGFIQSLIYNLVQNGVNYRSRNRNSWVNVSVKKGSDHVTLRVEDNGVGIAENLREKIFEMFFRASTSSPGSGLGLYIVKSIAARLNGKVNVKSEEGIGTTFEVVLPLTD